MRSHAEPEEGLIKHRKAEASDEVRKVTDEKVIDEYEARKPMRKAGRNMYWCRH